MMKHIFRYMAVAFVILSSVMACSKEEETTKLYLSGTLKFKSGVPSFATKDEVVVYSPYGVTHPDGKALGLIYYISSIKTVYDTLYYADPKAGQIGPLPADYSGVDIPIVFGDIKDTLGTFSVTFTVYPINTSEYYTKSGSKSITIVDDDETIPEIAVDFFMFNDYAKFTDSRDGSRYVEVPLGGNTWLHRNLAYDGGDGSLGLSYYSNEALSYILGRYYTWDEAITACPPGWKLPSNADWSSLGADAGTGTTPIRELMAPATFNGDELWEYWPSVGDPDNATRFSIIPVGYANKPARTYEGMEKYAAFWTSDLNPNNSNQAMYRYMYETDTDLKIGYADTNSMALSVRCIKVK